MTPLFGKQIVKVSDGGRLFVAWDGKNMVEDYVLTPDGFISRVGRTILTEPQLRLMYRVMDAEADGVEFRVRGPQKRTAKTLADLGLVRVSWSVVLGKEGEWNVAAQAAVSP